LVIKLLAAEIIAAHDLASGKDFAQNLAAIESNTDLIQKISELIEKSTFFESNGIKGFVEEAIFSWYLDSHDKYFDSIINCIRNLLIKLSFYRTDKLDHTRDVLKDFYQNLVPDTLRKSLGEFYTPDWLVVFSLDKLGKIDYFSNRFLDPTCGSGSFLLDVIRRKKADAKKNNIDNKITLQNIISTVWGFDLNPLAVQLARTNFLMAISDLLHENHGIQIEIPILLADAVYSPAQMPCALDEIVEYKIGSRTADLKILLPSGLALNRILLDKIFNLMEEYVSNDLEYKECENNFINNDILSKEDILKWRQE